MRQREPPALRLKSLCGFADQRVGNSALDSSRLGAVRTPLRSAPTVAGIGSGLAAHGWQVTAVDFAATALAHGRSTAAALGHGVAERIVWIEADLATWAALPDHYDLVVCLYVHAAGSVDEMVRRMASGVARGGTLFMVGHRSVDRATGAATAAAGQVRVSVEAATAALDPRSWEVVVAEERPRAAAGSGADAVIRARRRY